MSAPSDTPALCFSSPSVSAPWSRLTTSSFWKEAPSARREPTSSSWRRGDATGPWCRLLAGQVILNERLLMALLPLSCSPWGRIWELTELQK